MLDLKPGQNVLDVGCGIGGSAFYMAEVSALRSWVLQLIKQLGRRNGKNLYQFLS